MSLLCLGNWIPHQWKSLSAMVPSFTIPKNMVTSNTIVISTVLISSSSFYIQDKFLTWMEQQETAVGTLSQLPPFTVLKSITGLVSMERKASRGGTCSLEYNDICFQMLSWLVKRCERVRAMYISLNVLLFWALWRSACDRIL